MSMFINYLLFIKFKPCNLTDGWMPIPQAIPQNCPNGLQYLSTINQLLVKQQVEVLEGKKSNTIISIYFLGSRSRIKQENYRFYKIMYFYYF